MNAKDLICRLGDLGGAFTIGQLARFRLRSYVRAVNYHATPREFAERFEQQLRFYARHFDNADTTRLWSVLTGARHRRPAIALTFDDGDRSNYDVAAPLLEKHGFRGWFFICSGRLRDLGENSRTVDPQEAESLMSVAEARDLIARGHVMGSHTHSHARLTCKLGSERLRDEIVVSRRRLRLLMGDPIDAFCWVGGEEWAYSAQAHANVIAAQYALAFTTNCQIARFGTDPLRIDRTNVEVDWPLYKVRFYLSGAMDLAYRAKSRRVAAKLADHHDRSRF